jgi:hypothetical protein
MKSISATAIDSGVRTVTIVQGKAASPELAIGRAALEGEADPAASEVLAGPEASGVSEVLGASEAPAGPAAWGDWAGLAVSEVLAGPEASVA